MADGVYTLRRFGYISYITILLQLTYTVGHKKGAKLFLSVTLSKINAF